MNQHQPLTSGTIMCKTMFSSVLHRVDHEATRKADPNVSNIVIRHRFRLVPMPFPFLGLLEGAVVAHWHLFMQQQHYYYVGDFAYLYVFR